MNLRVDKNKFFAYSKVCERKQKKELIYIKRRRAERVFSTGKGRKSGKGSLVEGLQREIVGG